jgi:hypothetical protein
MAISSVAMPAIRLLLADSLARRGGTVAAGVVCVRGSASRRPPPVRRSPHWMQ